MRTRTPSDYCMYVIDLPPSEMPHCSTAVVLVCLIRSRRVRVASPVCVYINRGSTLRWHPGTPGDARVDFANSLAFASTLRSFTPTAANYLCDREAIASASCDLSQ